MLSDYQKVVSLLLGLLALIYGLLSGTIEFIVPEIFSPKGNPKMFCELKVISKKPSKGTISGLYQQVEVDRLKSSGRDSRFGRMH
jgi:hypothetical protein